MKIASWNVNSLRVRLPQVLQWIDDQKPDVLALQELKMETSLFPHQAFEEKGYQAAVNGQKTYNGVALLSRFNLRKIEMPDNDEQKRIISATIHGFRVINIYVPNGESTASAKYHYKLAWLKNFRHYLSEQLEKYPRIIILGDFNIAPQDEDVYDSNAWEGQVLCSASERQAFQEILKLGFLDSFRLFRQSPQIFSWWDYRTFGFKRNAGLRIDHIVISKALEKCCQSSQIDKIPRGWEKPSDHAPVIAVFESPAC